MYPENKIHRILISGFCQLILLISGDFVCRSQQNHVHIVSGWVTSSPRGINGSQKRVGGATLSLASDKDTLTAISSYDGTFIFKKVPTGKASLTVRHVSYQTKILSLDIREDAYISIVLDEKSETINEARVQAEAPVYSIKGDTLQYNVSATQCVSRDETLQDVLLRLPGVTMENGRIHIMGEPLERIYIDKKLLFGDSTGAALRYMAADNIVRIKVYDQATLDDRRRRRESPNRERAINVETFTKMSFVAVGIASAGLGTTIGKDGKESLKYGTGVAANYFSEKLMLSGTLRLDNLGKNSGIEGFTDITKQGNREGVDGYAGIQYMQKFGDPIMGKSLSANYSFGYGRNSTESEHESIYDQGERIWSDNTLTKTKSGTHNAVLSWMNPGKLDRRIELAFRASQMENTYESSMQRQEGGESFLGEINRLNTLKSYHLDFRGQLGGSKWSIYSEGGSGWNNGDYSQYETSLKYSGTTVSTPVGNDQSIFIRPYLSLWSRHDSSLDIMGQIGFNRNFTHEEKIKDGIPDIASSVLNTYMSYGAQAGIRYEFRKEAWSFKAKASLLADMVMQDMQLPVKDNPGKWFISPNFNVSAGRNSPAASQILSVELARILPSSSNLSGYLNTTNPYFIQRGNPDLKQTVKLMISYSANFLFGTGYSLMAIAKLGPAFNDICRETYYFRSEEERFGYRFAPGTTLDTYSNVNTFNANTAVSFKGPIPMIKVLAQLMVSYDFLHDSGYIDGVLHPSMRHTPSMKASLTSNFSQRHKITAAFAQTFNYRSTQDIGNSSYLLSELSVRHRSTFPFGLTLQTYFCHTTGRPFTEAKKLSQNLLNIKAGYKVFPSKNGEISISFYDITDTWDLVSMSMGKNFVSTSTRTAPKRFWMVNFVYSFNTSRKGGSGGGFRNMPQIGEDYGRARVF